MGSKTFASIGKALPERINIVLTRDPAFTAQGCVLAHSVEGALRAARPTKRSFGRAEGHGEAIVIGGASIFEQFLPLADKMYLTIIDTAVDGDIYFPAWNCNEWQETSREEHEPDGKNQYRYAFYTFERRISEARA